jgi:hypothetical protein
VVLLARGSISWGQSLTNPMGLHTTLPVCPLMWTDCDRAGRLLLGRGVWNLNRIRTRHSSVGILPCLDEILGNFRELDREMH